MRIFIFSIFVLYTLKGSAQGTFSGNTMFDKISSRSVEQGIVTIHQSTELEQMMTNFAAHNEANGKVEGYRIQLYSGTGAQARQESQDVKTRMLSYFPQEKVVVEYNAPFWRVRTGAFRHKHEALPLLKKIKSTFPNCYIVKDVGLKLSEF